MKSIKWCGGACLAAIVGVLLLASCANKYIGKQVDTTHWWPAESLPVSYIIGGEETYFVFEISLSEGEVDGEYILEGHVDPTKGKAKSWSDFESRGCRFELLLAKDGTITDRVPFTPVGNSLSRKLPFKRMFTSAPFDSFWIIGKFAIRG